MTTESRQADDTTPPRGGRGGRSRSGNRRTRRNRREPPRERPLLIRWLTENRADTRSAGPPRGRVYAAPFAAVWDRLLRMIEERPRWKVQHADETEGFIAATCKSRFFGFVDDLTLWVRLDRNGLTEVAARSRSRTGKGDFGVNRRRIQEIMATLDEDFPRV